MAVWDLNSNLDVFSMQTFLRGLIYVRWAIQAHLSLWFLGWNYLCLGIEPLFELSIFTAADKVKDVYCITRCEKINWTYWDTCQYYIIHCSIGTIWVHFKRNYNFFDQVLINVITFCIVFSLFESIVITSLTQACLSLITWTVHYMMN